MSRWKEPTPTTSRWCAKAHFRTSHGVTRVEEAIRGGQLEDALLTFSNRIRDYPGDLVSLHIDCLWKA